MEGWKEWVVNLNTAAAIRHKVEEDNWLTWHKVYHLGLTPNDDATTETSYRIKLARVLLSVLLPSLYFKNPYVVVNPRVSDDMEATESARIMEALINYYIQGATPTALQVKRHARKCIIDAFIYNKAFLESRWYIPSSSVKGSGDIEYGKTEAPIMERISVWDVCIDPYASDDIHNARWYARRSWVSPRFVRENASFNPRVRTKFIESETIDKMRELERTKTIIEYNTTLDLEAEGFVQLWTVYDRKYNRMMVFNNRVEGFLIDTDNPYEHVGGFPVSKLSFDFDTDTAVSSSLVDLLMPQQEELNHICMRIYNYLRRFARVILVEEDALAEGKEGERKFVNARDGDLIKLRSGRLNSVKEIEFSAQRSAEFNLYKRLIVNDAQFSLGIPPTQVGTGHDKFKSATETSLIHRAFDIRVDDLREQVANWLEEAFRIMGGNIKEFLDMNIKLNIAGKNVIASKANVQNTDFDYQVLLAEAAPENETKRINKAEAIYQMALRDVLLDRKEAIINKLRALGEMNPYRFLSVSDIVPGNVPPQPGSTPEEAKGMASELIPEELKPAMTGGIGNLFDLIGAGKEV